MITVFAHEQHDLCDGHYVMSANRIYMVGGLNDPVVWSAGSSLQRWVNRGHRDRLKTRGT
jgi:hypothetical protein